MPLTDTLNADVAAALPGPEWLHARRVASVESASAPLPTDAEELWRYSRVNALDLGRYSVAAPAEFAGVDSLPPALAEALAAVGPRSALLVLVDGFLVHREVDASVAGLEVGGPELFEDSEGLDSAGPNDTFAALTSAFTTAVAVVRVARGAVAPLPVVVASVVTTPGVAVFPHVVVEAGEASQVGVVELSVGTDDVDALVSSRIHFRLDQAANVSYTWLQRWGRSVWHVANASAAIGRDATLSSAAVFLGGGDVRLRTDAEIVGQGGSSNLRAVYFGDGDQLHDFRVVQGHAAPRSHSDLFFKGAVGGTAHAVYSGVIRVDKGAAGTNGFQTIRNLVLSDGAWADAVPNLEIEENDVACSHATTVGPIDEDQRYYLESRGVPPEAADRLIVLGFFDEVLDQVGGGPGLRDLVRADIARRFVGVEVSA